MKKLCLGLFLVFLMLVSPIVCFGDTVIPISGSAVLMFERGAGDVFQISGPGFSFLGLHSGGGESPVTYCDPGICIFELQAEFISDDWSYPGLINEPTPWGPMATADFTIFPIPFMYPASCLDDPWGGVCNPSVPASILGTILFPAANGRYMDARFIGTGTLQLTDAPGAEWNGWIEKSMDFQGTAFLSPEPGTFTLLGIAGIASIVGILFRRRYSNA